MRVRIDELPLADGVPVGQYRLFLPGCNEAYYGVAFVNGVSSHPVGGHVAAHQYAAWGPSVGIEPWDQETAKLIIYHLEKTGRAARAAELLASLDSQDPKPHAKKVEVPETQEVAAKPKRKKKSD